MGVKDYRLVENNGESLMLPLNGLILNSGVQHIRVKVYPKEGETILSSYARVALTLYFATDKDCSLKDYQKITSFKLPEDIVEQKLPYYEGVITFRAEVPFDYKQELDKVVNLKDIPNIEKKIVAKHQQLKELMVANNNKAYRLERIHSDIVFLDCLYANEKEIIKNSETIFSLADSRVDDKQVLSIENYTIQFYAEGKVVALWQKNLNPMLYITGKVTNSEGFTRKIKEGSATFLYIPEGSDELKVW